MALLAFSNVAERALAAGDMRWRCGLRIVCVSLFYVIDTGSIGPRARIEMGVTYLPFALAQTLAMPMTCFTNMDGYQKQIQIP